jgi:hypothetical protein
VSSFTYKGSPVLSFANFGGAEQIETTMTGQTLATGGTQLLFSSTLTPVSTHGVTVSANSISLTKKGQYTFKVQPEVDIGASVKVRMQLNGVDQDAWNASAVPVGAANVSFNHVFYYQKRTTSTDAITFVIFGDSYPTTGTAPVVSSGGEIKILFAASAIQ